MLTLGQTAWNGEDTARGVDQIAMERIARDQAAEHLAELSLRIALKSDEEGARIELPGGAIDAIGEAVAPTQDSLTGVPVDSSHPNVRTGRDQEIPLRTGRLQIGWIVKAVTAERGSGGPVSTDDRLLLVERHRSPLFECDPDPTSHQIGPASEPARRG